jgi:hypothetical protein
MHFVAAIREPREFAVRRGIRDLRIRRRLRQDRVKHGTFTRPERRFLEVCAAQDIAHRCAGLGISNPMMP